MSNNICVICKKRDSGKVGEVCVCLDCYKSDGRRAAYDNVLRASEHLTVNGDLDDFERGV